MLSVKHIRQDFAIQWEDFNIEILMVATSLLQSQ